MSNARLIQISKLMSLILRHRPEQFGVALDPEGYASVQDVVRAVQRSVPDASAADIRRIVETLEPDKSRFSISGADIRANYGHSLSERITQPQVVPPHVLLHGTSEDAVDHIRRDGIRPMRRQYVHLTTSPELAARVGGRHGRACVLKIDALGACNAGIAFYRANDSFWLADLVPPDFVL